jgi:hypothetical protein
MARLVPARPLPATPAEEDTILALEGGLDDSWVIFQKRPDSSGYLAVHPDLGACLVAVAAGLRTWDPDSEAWHDVDMASSARAAAAALTAVPGIAVRCIAYLPDTPAPGNSMAGHFFSGDAAKIPDAVNAVLSLSPAPPGDQAMNDLIQLLSPNAAAYVRDTVSAAQQGWRASRTPSEIPPPPADEPGTVTEQPGAPVAVINGDSGPEPGPVSEPMPSAPDIIESDPVIRLLRQLVISAAMERECFVGGMAINADEAVAPDFLLPALLVSAAEDWTPVILPKGGKGGFLIYLKSDPTSLLGYRVTHIEPSSLFLLMIAVADKLRRSVVMSPSGAEEIIFDGLANQFARFLSSNGINLDLVGDVETRVYMKKLDI